MSKTATKKYKKQMLRIARDLCYPDYVLKMIQSCRTEIEIEHIMIDARNGVYR